MTTYGSDGGFVPEAVADVLDTIGDRYRAFPGYYHPSYEARAADARHQRQLDVESRLVAALVTLADRMGDEERAVILQVEARNGDEPDDDEATRLAREHGFSPDRLIALRGLARSRDVELAVVLRASLRGELRDIVRLPPVPPVP